LLPATMCSSKHTGIKLRILGAASRTRNEDQEPGRAGSP
jgi:hypothetical protein